MLSLSTIKYHSFSTKGYIIDLIASNFSCGKHYLLKVCLPFKEIRLFVNCNMNQVLRASEGWKPIPEFDCRRRMGHLNSSNGL
jgi:hypothetical protein